MAYPIIYVAPDGKVYKRIGAIAEELPTFGSNTLGELIYKYRRDQEYHAFIIDSEGNLRSDTWVLNIDENGEINSEIKWELMTDIGVTPEMQKAIDLLRSHNKRVGARVVLLDENYIEVDELSGRVVGISSYDIDSSSDIRRTCTLTLSVPAKEQLELDFEKTWNKRMVELYCGLYDFDGREYKWFSFGRMLMVDGSSVFNATTQEIKLNLVDLMSSLMPERGSQIGETYLFQAGDDPKDLVEGIVAENTIYNQTDVCEFEDTIPYDNSSDRGDYAIDVLHLIFDLFPYYQFFYNNKGKFIAQQIPTKISDPVDIGATIIDDFIISEKKTVDFTSVKNTTEVWGRSLSGDYVAIDCTSSGTNYLVTIDESFTELVQGETFTVVPPTDSVTNQGMKIQDTNAYQIYTADGAGVTYTPIPAGTMKAGISYVLRYFEEKYVLQGELQIRCIIQEITENPSAATKEAYRQAHACENVQWIVNPDSPFACTINSVTGAIQGEIKQVLSDGEYENIYTTELAYERASYENWLKCRLQDTVEIEMILIPWMDVNNKIQYTSPVSGELCTWLVQGISYNFTNWTMTVKASKFYPYYPFWE